MQTRLLRLKDRRDIRIETNELNSPGAGEVLIRMGAGGICGSDLHYYQDGGFGPIRVKAPIILGHEVAGIIHELGPEVTNLSVGDKVSVNPSYPSGDCKYCLTDLSQHCLNMRFFGSALRFPHEQGAFRDLMVVRAQQCLPIEESTSLAEAACAEPLAVCLHALSRAPDLRKKRVLITGSGPIGVLCVALASYARAGEIFVTDLEDMPLEVAKKMGASQTINVSGSSDEMADFSADKGYFDLAFACSAAKAALQSCIASVRPQGAIIQIGVTGDLPIPINLLVGKEISLVGTHRFHSEFAAAVQLIDRGIINVAPMISYTYPLEQSVKAFEVAGDRTRAVKVQLSFLSDEDA